MIVLVDDQSSVLMFLKKALEDLDSQIHSVQSAEEAKQFLLDHNPDLIICDILMPQTNGFELRGWYEETFPYRRTPFIFHSALNGITDEIKGLDSGADEYLPKPMDPNLLRARVRALLRLRRRSLSTTFEGILQDYSPEYILRFCRRTGLTGAVLFTNNENEMMWTFKSGDLMSAPHQSEETLLKQVDPFRQGRFQILATPPNFQDFVNNAVPDTGPVPLRLVPALPPGLLSGLRIGDTNLDIQTEVQQMPKPALVSTIFANGRLLKTFSSAFDGSWEFARIQQELDAFHQQSKIKIQGRIALLLAQKDQSIAN